MAIRKITLHGRSPILVTGSMRTMALTWIILLPVLLDLSHGIEIYPPRQKIFAEAKSSSVLLPCNYRKAPSTPSSIRWEVNGRTVFTVDQFRNGVPGDRYAGRVRLGQSASLLLLSPRVSDTGVYTCTVTLSSGSNPTATGTIDLTISDCEEPGVVGVAICVALVIVSLACTIVWFVIRGRPGIIKEEFFRKILICLAVGSMVACVTSLVVLIIYVSTACVQNISRMRVAGIVFCVVGTLAGILCWLATTKKLMEPEESASMYGDDDSEISKGKSVASITVNEPAMLDGPEPVSLNGKYMDDDLSRDRLSIPDDVVKIVGTHQKAPRATIRRSEQLRTREHVDMPVERYLPSPANLSDVFFEDDAPAFARPATYRGSKPSSQSSHQQQQQQPLSTFEDRPSNDKPIPAPRQAKVQTAPQKQPRTSKQSSIDPQVETDGRPARDHLTLPDHKDVLNASNKDPNSLRKARSEEVLRRGASLVTIPPERRSLPLSVEEKINQDIFLESCKKTTEYFVETSAYKRLEKHLLNDDTRGVTITGRAGDGKTASAMYAAWKLYSTAGFLPLKVRSLAEIERIYIEGLKLTFVLDEPFGQLCLSTDQQEYWMTSAKRLQSYLSTPNVKVIATVRYDIWNTCLFSVMRFSPFTAAVNISTALTRDERQEMLVNHLSLAGVNPRDPLWKQNIQSIVLSGTETSFPQCCQLVRTSDRIRQQATNFFYKPLAVLKRDIHKLRQEDPVSFCILALVVSHGCKLTRSLLARPLEELPKAEKQKVESIWKACHKKFSPLPDPDTLHKKAESLSPHYITKDETSLEFSLTTLAEVVLLEMAGIDIDLVYQWCHPDIIIGKLLPEDCGLESSTLPQLMIQVPASHCQRFAGMLTEQLLKGNVKHVLQNPAWTSTLFLKCWNDSVLTKELVGKIRGVHGDCCQGEVLHRAACKGLLSMLQILLSLEMSGKEGIKIRNEYGQTLLHTAAIGGHVNVVEYLIHMGCAIDATNISGETPLFLASLHGNMDVVQLLLDHKANPDKKSQLGIGPLHAAIFGDSTEIVWMLLSRVSPEVLGGTPRTKIGITSFRDQFISSLKHSGLHEAARTNDLVRIHHLLDNGYEKNDQNKYGWTPLFISVLLGNVDAAALLLTRGADPNVLSQYGSGPLDEACCTFNDPLFALLWSFSPKKSSCL